MNQAKFQEIDAKIRKLESDRDRITGQMETVTTELKTSFGVTSSKQAETKLAEIDADIKAREAQIAQMEKEFGDAYPFLIEE